MKRIEFGNARPSHRRGLGIVCLLVAVLSMPVQARMTLSGSANDIQDFLDMLEACSCKELGLDMNGGVVILGSADGLFDKPVDDGDLWENASETSMEVICEAIEGAADLNINVGRGQPGVIVDRFRGDGNGDVDVGDLEQFPESPPAFSGNCSTRCQSIVHILAEYQRAATNGIPAVGGAGTRRDFNDAHAHAIDVENQHREQTGQTTSVTTTPFRPPNGGAFVYNDGTEEIARFMGGNITSIEWP